MKKKILFYCEQQFGAGHFQRTTNIINSFLGFECLFDIHFMFGGKQIKNPDFDVPVNYMLIPKIDGGIDRHFQADMAVSKNWDDYSKKRKEEISKYVKKIQPIDVLMLEFFPFGRKELSPYFIHLIQESKKYNPKIKVFSYVREVIDGESNETQLNMISNFIKYFDGAFICGRKDIYNFCDTNALIKAIDPCLKYTNYVVPPRLQEKYHSDASLLTCICSVGGGRDGLEIQKKFLSSFIKTPYMDKIKLYVFLSRHYEESTICELRLTYECKNIEIFEFTDKFDYWLAKSDLHFCMGGYNSIFESIASGCFPVIFPREWEKEQQIRGAYLSDLKLACVIKQENITPEAIQEAINQFKYAKEKPSFLNGGDTIVSLLLQENIFPAACLIDVLKNTLKFIDEVDMENPVLKSKIEAINNILVERISWTDEDMNSFLNDQICASQLSYRKSLFGVA